MADKRGGRRVPDNPASYSGVGQRSRRTDQPLRSPQIQDSTELPQGSREQILQGQRTAPLSRTPTPRVQAAPRGGPPPPAGAAAPSGLPAHLFEMPTNRPLEPETTGLPFGPGGGPEVLQSYQEPDDRQLILRFLARGGNEDANRILSGMVDSQRPPEPEVAPLLSSAEEVEVTPEEELLGEPSEDIAPEELPPEEPNIPEEAVME